MILVLMQVPRMQTTVVVVPVAQYVVMALVKMVNLQVTLVVMQTVAVVLSLTAVQTVMYMVETVYQLAITVMVPTLQFLQQQVGDRTV